MVGTNTSCDGNLELLRLCETLGGEVTWMETTIVLGVLHTKGRVMSYGVVMMISASTSS